MSKGFKVFAGNSNRPLAEKICRNIGVRLGKCEIRRFSDGEIWVKYSENIRGLDVFIVQSTGTPADNLLELLIMIDAARRSSANKITAVIPYFGYARQDRKDQPRVSITAKLIANLITVAGADRVITMDLHAGQVQGFFDIPVDHLYASAVFVRSLSKQKFENLVVASPDVGGIKLARAYAKRFNADLVLVDKRRPQANVSEIINVIGEVKDKNIIIVDDLIDTAGTLTQAVYKFKERGAKSIIGICTHAVFSGGAVDLVNKAPIEKLYVTDTQHNPKIDLMKKVSIISVASIFGEAIVRTYKNQSISTLFDIDKG